MGCGNLGLHVSPCEMNQMMLQNPFGFIGHMFGFCCLRQAEPEKRGVGLGFNLEVKFEASIDDGEGALAGC